MDFEQARFKMIEQQIRPWEVLDPAVLDLLSVVRREDFVPPALRDLAFTDMELPIGNGQSMLAPKIEARMLQEIGVRKTDVVLEIGSGSGYMAALLASKAEYVVSIEVDPELARMAEKNLARAGIANVSVEVGDGARGWPEQAPYDVIVISGSLPELPDTILSQLKLGGRLVAIVGEAPAMSVQLVTRTDEDAWSRVNLFETVVAPLANAERRSAFVF
ncbi:protein-L-isoaspartate O-methyltransferase family protein [Rhodocyclus tenuis]|uniref:Protein-L-isoaspartate O-methyltransferase n=1 Tax=Rhodocyclus tenuis TaxID=1066 RepID=A0A840G6I0_RHOTE|nr:protein-L-isoaspartate O-methyltransferase [Rhodocyclus tenuis]MBB4246328.1 protein-L-isoaspartate(D-aspartate) O-methyltransferase [Rhodocyclus tenuis]MBK1681878.1 protein-L-isoaspartate O-methyltransferase [Rhodocyclus tenuis]